MNKKLVLSVLSTALVASMASAAMAKPSAGIYIGGDVDKYYSAIPFLDNFDAALDEILDNLEDSVFVDPNGYAAKLSDALSADDINTVLKPATEADFEANDYKVVGEEGKVWNPKDETDWTPEVPGELKVESVSAINASQVEVKFASAVEKKSAEDDANYTLESYTGAIVAKLVDEKTVVVTLDPSTVSTLQQESKTLTVANIKSATDESKKIETFSGKVSFLDLTLPKAVEAKLVAPGKVQVYFDEPVFANSGVGFLIDGGQYSVTVSPTDFDPATKSVTLSTGALSQGSHTVTVNPEGDKVVKDGAGLFVAKTDIQFNVTADVTAPSLVSATASSQNSVVLTFDEPIKGIAAGAVYHTAKNAAYSNNAAAIDVPGSDKKQWKVTFTNPLPTGNLTINVDKEAVEDNFGNKNANVLSTTISVVSDTVKPTVTEVKVVSANRLTIAFSEDVTGADAKANYKITDSTGKAVGFNVSFNTTDKKATIDFTSSLKEGATYTVEVTGIKDKAVVPNEIEKYTTSFTVADKTVPTVDGGLYDVTNRKITIFFSEAMNGTELLDKSKYTLAAGTKQVALPSNATVAVGPNNSSVNITLPTVVRDGEGNDITNTIDKVIVGQLSDLAGNKSKVYTEVTVNTTAGTIGASDVVGDSAVTVDSRTVKLSIKKPLKTIVAADFTVNGVDVEFAQYENKTVDGTYGAEITLQVKALHKWATDETPVIATKSGTLKSVSMYGDTFAPSTNLATAADAVAPALADVNGDQKVDGKDLVLIGDANGDIKEIVVSFSEDLQSGTVSIEDFEVVGHTVSNAKLDGSDDSKVVITLKKAADAADNFTVRFVGAVSDLEGNTYAGNGVELANKTVTKADQNENDFADNATTVDGVTLDYGDGTVTVDNQMTVDADEKVTGQAEIDLNAQTPGTGSDAGKSYVGYTVSAPVNGTLTAAFVTEGNKELGDAKDDAGSASSKGYVNFYQAIAQAYDVNGDAIASNGDRSDIDHWKKYDFNAKTYTIKWVYDDGNVQFTTFTVAPK